MRDFGEVDAAAALPDALVVAFGAVTHLADTWFLFLLLAIAYWFLPASIARHPRRTTATLVATVVCGLAAMALAKVVVGAPRPPAAADPATVPVWFPGVLGTWFEGVTVADGFAFPSGHATGAAVTYLGLALLLDRPARRTRLAVAGALVVGIATSRVVLRVHYVADVVAGVLFGAALLVACLRLAGDDGVGRGERRSLDPTPVFLLAALVGIAVAVVGWTTGDPETVVEGGVAVGTAVGGVVGWQACTGAEPTVPTRVAVPGIAVTGLLWGSALGLAPSAPLAGVLAAAATAAILALPAVAERVAGDDGT